MQVRQLLIRAPSAYVPSISRFLPLLNALSLEDETLRLVRWRPSEGWENFLEFRLQPMVYFVHAAVTHDFTLVGAKGVYSLVELDHIKYWRLVLSSRCAVRSVYLDDVCVRYPPVVGMPGEATAMFEIMHRVCRSIGYPFDQETWDLNLNLLIPLVESARETRALLQTELDYPVFDKHGQLLIPDFYSLKGRPLEGATFSFRFCFFLELWFCFRFRLVPLALAAVCHVTLSPPPSTSFSTVVDCRSRLAMPPKTRSRTRLSAHLTHYSPSPASSPGGCRRNPSKNRGSVSEGADTDDGSESDFVPNEKTASPDSDEEFPPSLPIPTAGGEMDVDKDSTPPRKPRPSGSSSSRGKASPTKSSKSAHRAPSPQATASSRPPTPDKAVVLDLEERPLLDWAIPDHVPDFVVHRDPANPRPPRYLSYEPMSDVEIMETFKDPRLVRSRLEDSPPEVFDNPAYHISPTGKWLQKLADGDHSVARYCRVYNGMRVRLLVFLRRFPAALPPAELPADPNDPYYEYTEPRPERQTIRSHSAEAPRGRGRVFDVRGVPDAVREERKASGAARCARNGTFPTARSGQRRRPQDLGIPGQRLPPQSPDCSRAPSRGSGVLPGGPQGNTIGEYAYFLAKRALSRSGSGRGVSSRVAAASGEPVPQIAVPSKRGLREIDNVELPPIAAFSEGDTDSGEERPSEVSRTGAPSKGKAKATGSTSDREPRQGSVSNTSRIAPDAALSAKPEPPSAGSFLGTGSPELSM
ncbi:hypothetical protein B0H14DRAFT_2654912 [Mycena olivaceomarginata]|nr:hypothetical protein B0H14DRAFT_2654912 [Mycena olivaceomarginata]